MLSMAQDLLATPGASEVQIAWVEIAPRRHIHVKRKKILYALDPRNSDRLQMDDSADLVTFHLIGTVPTGHAGDIVSQLNTTRRAAGMGDFPITMICTTTQNSHYVLISSG
jgi:hypothetical protein